MLYFLKIKGTTTIPDFLEDEPKTIAELREIIKEAGLSETDNEKLHSLEDLKKIFKEEQNK